MYASPPWHAIAPGEALHRLGSSPSGLEEAEAAQRLAQYGPNAFRRVPPMSAWAVLVGQFRSLIVLLLVGAAAIVLIRWRGGTP